MSILVLQFFLVLRNGASNPNRYAPFLTAAVGSISSICGNWETQMSFRCGRSSCAEDGDLPPTQWPFRKPIYWRYRGTYHIFLAYVLGIFRPKFQGIYPQFIWPNIWYQRSSKKSDSGNSIDQIVIFMAAELVPPIFHSRIRVHINPG